MWRVYAVPPAGVGGQCRKWRVSVVAEQFVVLGGAEQEAANAEVLEVGHLVVCHRLPCRGVFAGALHVAQEAVAVQCLGGEAFQALSATGRNWLSFR